MTSKAKSDSSFVSTLPEEASILPNEDSRLIKVSDFEGEVRLLAVRYDGTCFASDAIEASSLKYKTLWKMHAGDLVLSNINAVNGAIGVVPEDLAGCFVSSEYTVLRAKSGFDPYLLQLLLRSPECRADLLLNASGIGRHRVTVEGALKTRIPLPAPAEAKKILKNLAEAREYEKKAKELFSNTARQIESDLAMNTTRAREILSAFKPPK